MSTAGSVFTGVAGFDLALERLGFTVIWQVEIDQGCNRVLVRRFPGVLRMGDVRSVGARNLVSPDLLVGGFPCQGLSVAGKRGGLADPRSALFFEFARLAEELRPPWLLIENVPGLASNHRGRDLAVLLNTLARLDFDAELVTLDSRYTGGVAQRRERKFIVGHLRAAGPCPLPIFLEPQGGDGNPAAGRQEGEEAARPLTGGSGGGGQRWDYESENFVTAPVVFSPLSAGSNPHSNAPGRRREDDENLIAFALPSLHRGVGQGHNTNYHAAEGGIVRRLTPLECERLQAFPDGWTCICGATEEMLSERGITEADWRLSDFRTLRLEGHTARCRCKDSPRYRALGNAVTVTVAEWVLRIMLGAMREPALEGR